MATKVSTLILKVDLQCAICSKKIKKVLGKLQDRENIQSVVYNEKEGIVIVSGPFDPKRLSKKLCCKACKVIKEIIIKPDDPPPPPPPEPVPEPPPGPEKPPPAPPKPEYLYLYPYPYPYPYPAAWPFFPVCGCNGWCQCKSTAEPPPPAPPAMPTCSAPCYDGCRTCKFICEEEPSACSIM